MSFEPKTPLEEIVRRDHFLTIFNADRMLREKKFIVDLACGHKVYTGATERARCPRCTEMLRRSIETGQEDWESYRKGLIADEMIWPEDPCRTFNEKTDLEGRFIHDPKE